MTAWLVIMLVASMGANAAVALMAHYLNRAHFRMVDALEAAREEGSDG